MAAFLEEGSYDQIPDIGLSPDYVLRETKRTPESAAGTTLCLIWPGIDIDIPTEPNNSNCTPQSVKAALQAAFRPAPGVILSRNYSEMRLANLSRAGDDIRELKIIGRTLLRGDSY